MELGAPLDRVEGWDKVAGRARYSGEQRVAGVCHAVAVQAEIAHGEVLAVDATAARAVPGVIDVLAYGDAPALADTSDFELAVLQSPRVAYRGQIVAAVVAETLEIARHAQRLVRVTYDELGHDVELTPDHPGLYRPEKISPDDPPDTGEGEETPAEVSVDVTYETPAFHNNPMEPHATLAVWEGDHLTLYDSTQGAAAQRDALAALLGMPAERVRVVAHHVGGGFGSKGVPPRPNSVLAALCARRVGRPVKLAVTRQQMFSITGYRTPTFQRMRIGASKDGRIADIEHHVIEQTSTAREFAEQSGVVTRMMYAARARRTTHRLARLDVPVNSWMRAPGECPGMYALESAMDELAEACGIDPVELRIRNEPERDPDSGNPFSSRRLVECLRLGAERFGWSSRPEPGTRREGRHLVGMGVAAATYPAAARPAQALARVADDGSFTVSIAAADIGTGARTALTQIAADALGVPVARVRVEIGDSALPYGPLAGGSMGNASWGWAVLRACEGLRDGIARYGGAEPGLECRADTSGEIKNQEAYARHSFGAQFAEVRVDVDSGEIRVPRMLGVFAAGRVMNARLARSQFVGGMVMGLGMALTEESRMDREFGDYLNHDLAQYHVPVNADVLGIDAIWLDDPDPHANPLGGKGIGEIGIVGAAAAIGNAVHNATGHRFRRLPISPPSVIPHLP
ncbi:xanthine dehydrogenase family protein molybdopterin-binding subunit [Bailinhaonella thermotolerans]|uniref:Xanthine dehydrogenase family protein molybdopterin-binding subunit n=1 Tax=Bailinhaonella thermotolerans TaxID=1070861 RepID=A0A3A4ADP6_9ACTN|nr:xanthine dehydrogenase family protein molybdopterin-binding subunit [Bailinhaonella thermotolerans]RJL24170.1 xanthine dehydrogenase family protein molybdopterin-binding subunit [Bailinhaonella thermotolerans]